MKQKIAVAGDVGSFSEEAGLLYAKNKGIDPEFVYGIDVEGVLSRLQKNEVDLGIFPVVNSQGGLVKMAFDSMGKYLFNTIDKINFDVHLSLMVKSGVDKDDIKKIVSHRQPILQSKQYLKREFPQAEIIEWEDTARAAKDLANGTLSEDAAVIAPARSAEIYNLKILQENIQDVNPNITIFIVVEKYEK